MINVEKKHFTSEERERFFVRDVRSVYTKINYSYLNPVRKVLVERAEDYKYSSASF